MTDFWLNVDKPLQTQVLHIDDGCGDVQRKGVGTYKPVGAIGRDGGWLPVASVAEAVEISQERPSWKPLSFCSNCRRSSAEFRQFVEAAAPLLTNDRFLVLAENEATASGHAWKDVTGERYHFPNVYVNRIVPGARFVYYKGSRRTGGERAEPVYFGSGVIGSVYADPEAAPDKREWIAEIAEYEPFSALVPFRDSAGILAELGTEQPPAKNYWGVGVRPIRGVDFARLVSLGGMPLAEGTAIASGVPALSGVPDVVFADEIWKRAAPTGLGAGKVFDYRRLSKRAKLIGDEAERIFFDWLCGKEPALDKRMLIRWVAREGETPGYDIEDGRDSPPLAYEVKGTTGSKVLSVELTINELRCAQKLGDAYALVIVAGVFGPTPHISVLKDPAKMLSDGGLVAEPSVYRIALGNAKEAT